MCPPLPSKTVQLFTQSPGYGYCSVRIGRQGNDLTGSHLQFGLAGQRLTVIRPNRLIHVVGMVGVKIFRHVERELVGPDFLSADIKKEEPSFLKADERRSVFDHTAAWEAVVWRSVIRGKEERGNDTAPSGHPSERGLRQVSAQQGPSFREFSPMPAYDGRRHPPQSRPPNLH